MNFHAFRLLFPLLFWQLSVVIFAIFTRWALGVEPPAFALNPNLKPYPPFCPFAVSWLTLPSTRRLSPVAGGEIAI